MKTNWNDYWFQGDKLVRDFESMYKDIDEPWLQREKTVQPRLYVGLGLIQWMLRNDSARKLDILDVGAGLGGPTEFLRPYGKITATDISPTAVEKANRLVPDVEWVVDDIRNFREDWRGRFDLIWIFEVVYLVAPEIDIVLPNLLNYLKPDGRIILGYYMPDNAWTSRFIKDSAALHNKLSEYFRVEAYVDLNPFDTPQREIIALLAPPSVQNESSIKQS